MYDFGAEGEITLAKYYWGDKPGQTGIINLDQSVIKKNYRTEEPGNEIFSWCSSTKRSTGKALGKAPGKKEGIQRIAAAGSKRENLKP